MDTTTHEQDLKDIFNQLPSAHLSGDANDEVRLINFSLLESIVGKMMDKAYYHGRNEGFDVAETAVNKVFGL